MSTRKPGISERTAITVAAKAIQYRVLVRRWSEEPKNAFIGYLASPEIDFDGLQKIYTRIVFGATAGICFFKLSDEQNTMLKNGINAINAIFKHCNAHSSKLLEAPLIDTIYGCLKLADALHAKITEVETVAILNEIAK